MNAPNFDPYRAPETELDARRDARHSRIGVASLIAFGVSVFGIGLFIGGMALIETLGDAREERSAVAEIVANVGLAGSLSGSVVGTGLGLVGSLQRSRNRLTGVLGLVLNGVLVAGFVVLIVIGRTIAPRS